jgi:hypothetical protein
LQGTGELDGVSIGRQRPHARGKAGHPAVYELDPLSSQNCVIGEAQPGGFGLVAGVQISQRLDDLLGDQSGDPRIESVSQIGKPELLLRQRRQELFGVFQRLLAIFERLDLQAQQCQD